MKLVPGPILITGGTGFLGVGLAEVLLAVDPNAEIILADLMEHPRAKRLAGRVRVELGDLADDAVRQRLFTGSARPPATVIHLASLVSGGAERDFPAGLRANVHATMDLLESCRLAGNRPRVVFTSSIAAFGGSHLGETIDDWTHQHPQNSYGVAKVVGEQLLNDYSRKGFLCGRGVRFAAVVVRDEPNTAVSGYASGLVRELIAGHDYVCPVSPDTRIPIISVRAAVGCLHALAALDGSALGDFRTVNSPSISPSAGEIADAVYASGDGLGSLSFAPDPAIQAIVAAWPRWMQAERASAVGLPGDSDIDAIIRDYRAGLHAG